MLLNEFLKEHRKVEEQQATISGLKSTATKQQTSITTQEATIADLKKGMGILTAQLKEQALHIQKLSAQLAAASPFLDGLELSKFATGRIRGGGPAPQVVNNT